MNDEQMMTTGRSLVGFLASLESAETNFQRLLQFLALRGDKILRPPVPDEVGEMIDDGSSFYPEYKFGIVPFPPALVETAPLAELGIEWVEPERIMRQSAGSVRGVASFVTRVTIPQLEKTGVDKSPFSGKGITVAILDSGFDFGHPDFPAKRFVAQKSFVPQPVEDRTNGHGTHTTGTACGPRTSQGGTRYGIADEAGIAVGRVINASGFAIDHDVLEGIMWASGQTVQADIVLMAFGAFVRPDTPYSRCYERVTSGFAARVVFIAAAGNDNDKDVIGAVQHPANCPSIRAVASVSSVPEGSKFSCGTVPPGDRVDIAAPGENVLSSVPGNGNFLRASGTSMAAAHVAGIAALWAQREPGKQGTALWRKVIAEAAPKASIGSEFSGLLVKAPLQ